MIPQSGNNNEIGLIIWGLKGGYRVFCSNEVVNINEKVIRDTIKDIRGFIRFIANKIDIYALEFTDKYKIYTLYRSCYDLSNGAFVAFTVYVPHDKSVANIIELLKQMMDAYFRDYLAADSSYIPGKYDNIEPFQQILNTANVVNETRRTRFLPSVQNDRPDVVIYRDIDEVREYFKTPYRKEFFQCQEVMFISQTIYDNIPNSLKFNTDHPKIITHISEPEPLPTLSLDLPLKKLLVSLDINGASIDFNTSPSIQLNYSDIVNMVLSKPYHEELHIKGSVAQLKGNGYLSEIGRTVVVNVQRFTFKPIRYTFKVQLNGISAPAGLLEFGLEHGGSFKPYNGNAIHIGGNYADNFVLWGIRPYKNAYTCVHSAVRFRVADLIAKCDANNTGVLDLYSATYEYAVKTDGVKVSSLNVSIPLLRETFEYKGITNNTIIKFQLPSDVSHKKSELKFFVNQKDVVVKEEAGIINVERLSREYKLKVPAGFGYYFENVEWDFLIGDKSRRRGNLVVLEEGEKIKHGQLVCKIYTAKWIVKVKLDNQILKDTNEIIPEGWLIYPTGGLINVTLSGKQYILDRPALLPNQPSIDIEKYIVKSEDADNITILKVSEKDSGCPIPVPDEKSDNSLEVRIRNCKGGIAIAGAKQETIQTDNYGISLIRNDQLTIRKEKNECVIFKNQSIYTNNSYVAKSNEENHFLVRYEAQGERCIVEYNKPNFFANISKKAIIAASIGIVCLVGLGLGIGYYLNSRYVDVMELKFESSLNNADDVEWFLKESPTVTVSDTIDDNKDLIKYVKKSDVSNPKSLILRVKSSELKHSKELVDELGKLNVILEWSNGRNTTHQKYQISNKANEIQKVLESSIGKDRNRGDNSLPVIIIPVKPEVYDKYVELNSIVKGGTNGSLARKLTDEEYQKLIQKADDFMNDTDWIFFSSNIKSWLNAYLNDKNSIDDIEILEEYVKAFENNSNVYNSEFKVTISKLRRDEQDKERIKSEVTQKEDELIQKLQKMSCNRETLREAETWFNNLDSQRKQYATKISRYITAYHTFFYTTKGKTDFDRLKDNQCFSVEQREALKKGYCKSSEYATMLKGITGYDFNTPRAKSVY